MLHLDETNRALIALLRQDARIPVADLARRLGVSRATVQNRLKRLERDGVILGYTLRLAADTDVAVVRALVSIGVDAKDEAAVLRALGGFPAVTAVHHTTGRWDLIAEISADTLAAFNGAVGEIRRIDGIKRTETNLLLETYP